MLAKQNVLEIWFYAILTYHMSLLDLGFGFGRGGRIRPPPHRIGCGDFFFEKVGARDMLSKQKFLKKRFNNCQKVS